MTVPVRALATCLIVSTLAACAAENEAASPDEAGATAIAAPAHEADRFVVRVAVVPSAMAQSHQAPAWIRRVRTAGITPAPAVVAR